MESDLRANVEVSRQSAKVKKVGAYLRSIFNLSKLNENEIWMMKQFTCLPAEFHSYDLLYELIIDEHTPHKHSFSETLTELAKKGWLLYNVPTDNYKLHRIIAEVVKKEHNITIEDVMSPIKAICEKLSLDQTKENPVSKFKWIPYGQAVLDNFNKDLSHEIAHLQNSLGLVVRAMGDYNEAIALFKKAMHSNEKNFGRDHPATATSYSNLAMVLSDLGEYKEAKILLEKVMASDEKYYGTEHPKTALSYFNLALTLQDLADYEGAVVLLVKAMHSNERNFGRDHPRTAMCYSYLAMVLKDLGAYEEAKVLLEKAVKSDEKNFGTDHPNTARSYSNLATVLRVLGDYKNAKAILEKALLSDEKNFGKDHPTTAIRYYNLAVLLRELEDYDVALEFAGKALTIYKKSLPAGHPDIEIANSVYQSIKENIEKQST